uniref:Ig-like domain-containing protein n=1 Tax=Erpetoichthys calabaricus TaxID=27687 RepID=A0A8C4X9C3_ERPCA
MRHALIGILSVFLCPSAFSEISEVFQPPQVTTFQGGETHIYCNHTVSSYNSMQWYKQQPGQEPVILVYSYNSEHKNGRFSMVAFSSNLSTILTIDQTDLQDSEAVYYCGVRHSKESCGSHGLISCDMFNELR